MKIVHNSTTSPLPSERKQRIALVLQGGGALGAYQAGVYEALHEHELTPDWMVGTSIGAINAALIAGNKPQNRLDRIHAFWDRIAHHDPIDMWQMPDLARHFNSLLTSMGVMNSGLNGFFAPRQFNPFAGGFEVEPEQASFYDVSALEKSLAELIDFDYLNASGGMRLTVNAVQVTTGELVNFDNTQQPLTPAHIIASGTLPPGFPAVRVDGELYWDGGLYSNTPLETILDDQSQVGTLCFMVDLWNVKGAEPKSLDQVQTRQKDIMFASRSQRHIDDYVHTHRLQQTVRALYEKLSDQQKAEVPPHMLEQLGCNSVMHIVRLPYGGQDWHMSAKEINFSQGSLQWRWEQGYADATRGVEKAGWLDAVLDGEGVVQHELPPLPRKGSANR